MKFALICVTIIIGLFGCTVLEFVKPVALRITIPVVLEKRLEEIIKDQKGQLDAELDTRINTMKSSVDNVNKEMDRAQNGLYFIQKIVGVILSVGDKFSKNLITVADQFKERPETLHDLIIKVDKITEYLPGFTSLFQNLTDAGLETDETKQAFEALQLLKDRLLKEMKDAVAALPDMSKIVAQGGSFVSS